MPSFAQIKRLSLVLVIPLIILGVYLTDNDYLLETWYTPVCFEVQNTIDCLYVPFTETDERFGDRQFVTIANSTPLVTKFAHSVVLKKESFQGMGADFDPHHEVGQRYLVLEGDAYDPVLIAKDSERDNAWYYKRRHVFLQPFSFVDERINQKFKEGFVKARKLEKEVDFKNNLNKYFSHFIPLLTYLALLIIGFILIKVGGYIKNGVGEQK